MSRESIETSHVAFDASHHEFVGTCDPPWEQIYSDLDGQPEAEYQKPSKMVTAADGLGAVLHLVWRRGKGRAKPLAAFRKFLALSASMKPELFDARTLKQIGQEYGITRATLSKYGVVFSKELGIRFRRMHGGRINMSNAMSLSHQRRKQNENHNEPA